MSSEGSKIPHSDPRMRPSRRYVRGRPVQTSQGTPPQIPVNPVPSELRLVLLGKTGAGKSATGNTILGIKRFDDELSMSSVTKECKRERATVEGRELVLVDTPGLFDTDSGDEELQKEVINCLALSSPGPHAFLLVVPIERFTGEHQRTVEMILEMFHEDVIHHTILIFSHADKLRGESIETFISRQNQKVQELVDRFGRRFVAFDNTNPTDRDQMCRLLLRIDKLLARNENRHYTSPIMEVMQEAQKIIQEKMAERMEAIKKEVRKLADDRWRKFSASMNEERQDAERGNKRIQGRIKQIETDIKTEEQNVQPITARLERFRASLERERENLRRLDEEEKEKERLEREDMEKKELDIWIQEEEQRRRGEERQSDELLSERNRKLLIMLSMFMLGAGAGFAPALLAVLFPAAPAVEVGWAATVLSGFLRAAGTAGAAGGGSFWGTAGVFAARGAAFKLAALSQCSIQ